MSCEVILPSRTTWIQQVCLSSRIKANQHFIVIGVLLASGTLIVRQISLKSQITLCSIEKFGYPMAGIIDMSTRFLYTVSRKGKLTKTCLTSQVKKDLSYFARDATAITLVKNDSWILIGGGNEDKRVHIIDSEKLHQVAELKGHKSFIQTMSFESKTNILATAGGDWKIILWDLDKFSPIWSHNLHESPIFRLTEITDGRLISCSFDGSCKLVDIDRLREGWELVNNVELHTVCQNKNHVFCGDGKGQVIRFCKYDLTETGRVTLSSEAITEILWTGKDLWVFDEQIIGYRVEFPTSIRPIQFLRFKATKTSSTCILKKISHNLFRELSQY